MAVDLRPILQGVLSGAASVLNEAGRPPGRVELVPGAQAAWDDCCEGQLYLHVVEVYPTGSQGSPFPQMDMTQPGVGCGVRALAVHVGLGVIRCIETVDDSANAPTPEAVTNDGYGMLLDMSDLLDSLTCNSYPGVMSLKVGKWSPQGAQGGCAGGEWEAYLMVDPCLCR